MELRLRCSLSRKAPLLAEAADSFQPPSCNCRHAVGRKRQSALPIRACRTIESGLELSPSAGCLAGWLAIKLARPTSRIASKLTSFSADRSPGWAPAHCVAFCDKIAFGASLLLFGADARTTNEDACLDLRRASSLLTRPQLVQAGRTNPPILALPPHLLASLIG